MKLTQQHKNILKALKEHRVFTNDNVWHYRGMLNEKVTITKTTRTALVNAGYIKENGLLTEEGEKCLSP